MKLDFIIDPTITTGVAGYRNNEIFFKSEAYITDAFLTEELVHAYQDNCVYPAGTLDVKRTNIEFEAKLLIDIIRLNNFKPCCMTGDSLYTAWLGDWIEEYRGSNFPSSTSGLMPFYYKYLQKFPSDNPDYIGPIDNSFAPSAINSLFSSGTCTVRFRQ